MQPEQPQGPRMIAISSGKGGVGKSTVTANIAVAMADAGLSVGVVDADVYGPSIPRMLGAPTGKPAMSPDQRIVPAEAHGVKVISMAMLTDDDAPAILRGPMVSKYLQMFVRQVDWGALDVLLLDLPPGTGDIQLTLAQAFPLSGAVVVSTPQDVSLKIARRGLRMMEQVSVPVLGVIENMSGFTCPGCGAVTHIFHQGGGEAIARELGVAFLGKVPLDPDVVDCGDEGRPVVHGDDREARPQQAYRGHAGGADAGAGDCAAEEFRRRPVVPSWSVLARRVGQGDPGARVRGGGPPDLDLTALDRDDARPDPATGPMAAIQPPCRNRDLPPRLPLAQWPRRE